MITLQDIYNTLGCSLYSHVQIFRNGGCKTNPKKKRKVLKYNGGKENQNVKKSKTVTIKAEELPFVQYPVLRLVEIPYKYGTYTTDTSFVDKVGKDPNKGYLVRVHHGKTPSPHAQVAYGEVPTTDTDYLIYLPYDDYSGGIYMQAEKDGHVYHYYGPAGAGDVPEVNKEKENTWGPWWSDLFTKAANKIKDLTK